MFKRNRNKLLYFTAIMIFLLSFTVVYGIRGGNSFSLKPLTPARGATEGPRPVIKEDTVIKQEIRYLCGDKVGTRIPTTSDVIGLDFSKLAIKYSPENGWNIDDTVKNCLVLARIEERVCPYHRDFRHLGISNGLLSVFEGPLGFSNNMLQQEDININLLPVELKTDLQMAMDYDNQTPDTQGRLKAVYEFETETQLSSALENFDEYKE